MDALKQLTYDQAIKQIEAIISDLESTKALSVATYKQKAKEAKRLLDFCEKFTFHSSGRIVYQESI